MRIVFFERKKREKGRKILDCLWLVNFMRKNESKSNLEFDDNDILVFYVNKI